MVHFIIDSYPAGDVAYSRVNNLLTFYNQPHNDDIFTIGSSYVAEGIDAYIVEKALLNQYHINRSVYNLANGGDTILNRVGETDYVVAAKPKLVLIGLSYRDFDNTSTILQDHVLLPYHSKQINLTEFSTFFNTAQMSQITQSNQEFAMYRFIEKRKLSFISCYMFARNILLSNYKGNEVRYPNQHITNFKDPWFITSNYTEEEKKDLAHKLLGSNASLFDGNRNPVPEDMSPPKIALTYMIKNFQQNNIQVIIINMPINPMNSETINESSRKNLLKYLNSTGVSWYDFERLYPSEYFSDMHHLNAKGRANLSLKVAAIIADKSDRWI